jgi:hypothetical protein
VSTPRLISSLVAFQAFDAVLCAIPNGYVQKDLDRMDVPQAVRTAIPVVKVASVVGLLLGRRHPGLGALTSLALVGYFVCALASHVRAHDEPWRYVSALGMLGWCIAAYRAFRTDGLVTGG